MNIEKIKSHISALETNHQKLEHQIGLLEDAHASDEDISYFKKKKLKIRDEIAKYTNMIEN